MLARFARCTRHAPIASRPRRLLHFSRIQRNSNKEPILQEQPEQDRFLDMMNDRTFSLFRSLRIDVEKLKEEIEAKNDKQKTVITAAPFVEAVEIHPPPASVKPNTTEHKNHYFDTQEVYSELRYSGLSPQQSEIIMRMMQELIYSLVSSCTDRAVPVSAAANEAYLFDAASSEVRNEISNSRQTHATSYRSGLARLQRDVEITEHEATEMTNLLKADLDIEVHERKNSARAEENIIQLKIQELHNKISTRLNSELKSEIENLRWQITRRSLAAIAVIAGSLIWLTQTNSNKKTQITSKQHERKSQGTLMQVPVLAPSLSLNDEMSQPGIQIDDISTYSDNNSNIPSNDDSSGSVSSRSYDGSPKNE